MNKLDHMILNGTGLSQWCNLIEILSKLASFEKNYVHDWVLLAWHDLWLLKLKLCLVKHNSRVLSSCSQQDTEKYIFWKQEWSCHHNLSRKTMKKLHKKWYPTIDIGLF